jgi:hypothetical protein
MDQPKWAAPLAPNWEASPAPLLLATTLARYWGLRHRCHFTWTTDSKAAISRVTIYTGKGGPHNQQYPEHSDYVTAIQELCKELRCQIKIQWVKGHQDDDKDYNELPRDARLNIDVDELATKHRVLNITRPQRKIEHLPSQRISLTINGVRYPGNWDVNLRWSINGFYLKQYLVQKHNWTETIWQSIDFSIIKFFFSSQTKTSEQRQWFKFMHDLQPLGKRKHQMGATFDQNATVETCPCCNVCTEDQKHFVTCERNPNHIQAHVSLTTHGSKSTEHHTFVEIMTDCIEQWLLDSSADPSTSSPISPTLDPYTDHMKVHMMRILTEALEEQQRIGWLNAIRGFLSKKWRVLASTHMDNIEASVNPQDGSRRIGTVIQRIQAFVRTKWEGRNTALHKHDLYDVEKFRTLEAAEIRHYHTQPHLLQVGDQHLCSGSLIKLLRSRPAYRRRWLRRVRKARANMIQDQSRQTNITTYFSRTSDQRQEDATNQHNNNSDRQNHLTPRQRPQNHTTLARTCKGQLQQAKVTHFFPGRPPDSNKTDNTTNKSHA